MSLHTAGAKCLFSEQNYGANGAHLAFADEEAIEQVQRLCQAIAYDATCLTPIAREWAVSA